MNDFNKLMSKLMFVDHNSNIVLDRIVKAIDSSKDINVFFDNDLRNTPLRMAVIANEYSIAALLLMYGADVTAIDRFGNSALHYAAMNKNKEMITLLKKHGASDFCPNLDGITPKDIIELDDQNDSRRAVVQAAIVTGLTVAACCITPRIAFLVGCCGALGVGSVSKELPEQVQKSLFFQKELVHRMPPIPQTMPSSVIIEMDNLRPNGQLAFR